MDHETGYVGLRGTVMSGAIAGLCGWSVAIPFDVVKNRHQVILHSVSRIKDEEAKFLSHFQPYFLRRGGGVLKL
jgi:hypothetical protein